MNNRELIVEDLLLFRELGLKYDSMFCPMVDQYWERWDNSDYKCQCFCYSLFPIAREMNNCPCYFLSQEEVLSKVNDFINGTLIQT